MAERIAERDKVTIVPTGAYAQNKLGFSTQVPMNVVKIQHKRQILAVSVGDINGGDTGITGGGPGSGPARARSFDWDDWDE